MLNPIFCSEDLLCQITTRNEENREARSWLRTKLTQMADGELEPDDDDDEQFKALVQIYVSVLDAMRRLKRVSGDSDSGESRQLDVES